MFFYSVESRYFHQVWARDTIFCLEEKEVPGLAAMISGSEKDAGYLPSRNTYLATKL
jgi:hypothetical protein